MFRKIMAALAISLSLASCVDGEEDKPESYALSAGDTVPAFSVAMSGGETVSSESLKGKVAVITFFNTSCPDCQKELPRLQEVYGKYIDNEEVKFVCVSRAEAEESVANYWKAHSLTLPYSAQEGREVFLLFASSTIPRIYITDKSGVIKAAHDDSPLATEAQLEEEIEALL